MSAVVGRTLALLCMSAFLLGSGCLGAAAAHCQGRKEGAWAAEPCSKAENAVSVGPCIVKVEVGTLQLWQLQCW